ncbi:XRE family transcriptional regulator [Nocardia yamanashiensis]|uniref:XRE family transcriptional regulator n=1 Tax=Nocardia yamanashiensis TaxID=209247 RepID=UPI001E48C7E7|nr:XRE family transcriptional regulator [Nocardia yamanashiensis]UGT43406.1 XRE family transcriptional regulator [Nocardia yamanashiensis]
MSRTELADAVNDYLWRTRGERRDFDSHTVARYERGMVRWPNEGYREALRAVLDASDAELGFTPARHRDPRSSAPQAVSCFSPFDLARVPADFRASDPARISATPNVGTADVANVRSAVREAAAAENTRGGGSTDSLAAESLRRFTPLIDGKATTQIRQALLVAVGNLSEVAGYAAFDAGDHLTADRYFRFALWCADAAGSWGLRAACLADMARRAAYIGNTDDALSLIELAQVRSDRLTATARAMLGALRAQYLGALGRTSEALAEVASADEQFAARTPQDDPPWLCYYDAAEHLGGTGKALIPIARERGRIELAEPRIRKAVALQGADYPRSRTLSLTRLATLTMRLGDPTEAVALGLEAVATASTLSSHRLHGELQQLAAASSRHRRISGVTELRSAILGDPYMERPTE